MPSMCLRPLLPFQLKQSRLIFTQWKQYKLLIAWWTMDIILFTSYFWKHLSFFSVPKKGLQLDNLTHHYRGSGLGIWLIKINWRTASSISNQSPKPNCCFHTAAGTAHDCDRGGGQVETVRAEQPSRDAPGTLGRSDTQQPDLLKSGPGHRLDNSFLESINPKTLSRYRKNCACCPSSKFISTQKSEYGVN